MSYKIQDRIQRIKGLPRKYKGLLLAMASHAHNDGTNVIAAKTTLAAEMGVVRFTVNRQMDVLLMVGLVVEAETHTCGNDFCSKGSKHYIEHGNHWTQAYNIDLVALQNVTPLLKKVVAQFVTESRHILCESGVTICAAKQEVKKNPASLGTKDEASALTSGNEGKKEGSVASKSPAEEKEKPEGCITEDKAKSTPLTPEVREMDNLWFVATAHSFRSQDYVAAQLAVDAYGFETVRDYLADTFICPKTSKVAWRDFSYWADSLATSAEPSTRRNIDAWRRATAKPKLGLSELEFEASVGFDPNYEG